MQIINNNTITFIIIIFKCFINAIVQVGSAFHQEVLVHIKKVFI